MCTLGKDDVGESNSIQDDVDECSVAEKDYQKDVIESSETRKDCANIRPFHFALKLMEIYVFLLLLE